ncbi:MAG: hypothetical protein FWD75_08190 [Propionibacteriaceae bacterium]|nr:hypothetical protein [Propionibacteriaceae bacterium]
MKKYILVLGIALVVVLGAMAMAPTGDAQAEPKTYATMETTEIAHLSLGSGFTAYKTVQGSATDGVYLYVNFSAGDGKIIMGKFNLLSGQLVAHSQVMDLGHGNALTYDPYGMRLVATTKSDNNPAGYISPLVFIDPESLTIVGTQDIGRSAWGVCFDSLNKRYVVVSSAGTYWEYNSTFTTSRKVIDKTVLSGDALASFTGTDQDVGCDSSQIYIPHSPETGVTTNNWISVWTWPTTGSASYVTSYQLDTTDELEGISVRGDQLILAFNVGAKSWYGYGGPPTGTCGATGTG